MVFTGQLGTPFSQPGQILLGSIGPTALSITVSSDLNSWQDSTARQLGKLLNVSDTLVFSDAVRIVLGLHKLIGDNLDNWSDAVTTNVPGFFSISVSDSLNNWLDEIALVKTNTATVQLVYKLDEVNYIRRYLNDVVTEVTDSFTFPSVTIYKANEIIYIRRYLNDV